MFYRGQLCKLDFQILDHKQCRRPHPPIFHKIYATASTEYLITFPLFETVTAHAPCHVTSNRGQK